MSAEPPNPVPKLPRRRNGREQACEPCRKSKMRCDHSLPICLNCQRRKLVEKCIYLPAPETRPHVRRSMSAALSTTAGYPRTLSEEAVNHTEPFMSEVSSEEDNPEGNTSILKPSSGFYGPTSFSAVFLDNENDLGSNVTSPTREEEPVLSPTDYMREANSSHLCLGVKVLSKIPDQSTCQKIFEFYSSVSYQGMDKGFHRQTLAFCMASLWSTFGMILRQPRSSRNLREMAKLLNKNTKSVLKDTACGDAWLASLSGRKLRWEMLGLLFATLGNTLLTILDTDGFWGSQSGQRGQRCPFALEMKERADECIQLSNQMDNINVLMVSLLFKRSILESQCTGDTSLMLWRQHGDLISATTGLGLHRSRDLPGSVSISSEMRRRTWAVVFCIDKTLASFTGRPPGLSHRYNSCPLPLDLDDEVLLQSKQDLAHAVSQLDENGWNTKGELYTATNLRANMIHGLLLSEVLELALGADSQYSDERLMDIKLRNEQTLLQYPSWLHFVKDTDAPQGVQWTRLGLRFRYLNCCLLLEQISNRRGQGNKQKLLDVAREMLELTVVLWTQRDQFRDQHYDYDFMIMFYGIPSSGVICVELMRQAKQPRSTHLHLPRSEVIPNLSLLVGFLDWVRPLAANSELCGRMRNEYTAGRREYIHALHEEYGPVVRLGPNEVSFSSGEAIKEIYTSGGGGYDKTEFYSLFKQFGYKTMFSTLFKSDHSQKKRHIAGQYANTNIMRPEVLGGIQERADVFIANCEKTEGLSTDVYVSLHCYALDCASHHLFHPHGTHSLEEESDLHLMQELSYHNSLQRYLTQYYFPALWKFFMSFSKPKRSPRSNEYVLRTSQISPESAKEREKEAPSPYSLLSKLHTSKFFQNDTEIAAECMDHMAAGIDTTGDALCFLIYQLCLPSSLAIQRMLQEAILSSSNDSELPYLDAVIKEGLRLFPPIPMSQPRYVPEKGRIIDGYYLPGRTIVSAQAWTVHRLESSGIFEKPSEFRPERWLFNASEGEKEKEMNRMFFSFGLGGRGCTGRQ
ncbi:cytochrome P450 [Phlyctema vagabunda]|uniref:Cytochrome P450 n=1 Tax=Phlyctema vagabunda TaxID=108571 RepID=A0ABR4PMT2_9HELO